MTGCKKEKQDKEYDEAYIDVYNIETHSLLAKTGRLASCSKVVEWHPDGYVFSQKEIENKKRCNENALKRRKEDKTYYYEINEKEMKIMCRNVPKFFVRSFENLEEPYPLKNHSMSLRKIIHPVIRYKGKKYFDITEESADLKNPVFRVSFNKQSHKYNRWFQKDMRCEISNPQDKYKKTYEEIH